MIWKILAIVLILICIMIISFNVINYIRYDPIKINVNFESYAEDLMNRTKEKVITSGRWIGEKKFIDDPKDLVGRE